MNPYNSTSPVASVNPRARIWSTVASNAATLIDTHRKLPIVDQLRNAWNTMASRAGQSFENGVLTDELQVSVYMRTFEARLL